MLRDLFWRSPPNLGAKLLNVALYLISWSSAAAMTDAQTVVAFTRHAWARAPGRHDSCRL